MQRVPSLSVVSRSYRAEPRKVGSFLAACATCALRQPVQRVPSFSIFGWSYRAKPREVRVYSVCLLFLSSACRTKQSRGRLVLFFVAACAAPVPSFSVSSDSYRAKLRAVGFLPARHLCSVCLLKRMHRLSSQKFTKSVVLLNVQCFSAQRAAPGVQPSHFCNTMCLAFVAG